MDEKIISSTLKSFFNDMCNWEKEFYTSQTTGWDDVKDAGIDAELARRDEQHRNKLRQIFGKYVEDGKHAKRISEPLYSGGPDPHYNPNSEDILTIREEGNAVVIETQMLHNLRLRLRYTLVESNGEWLIKDNRVGIGQYDTKWMPVDL